ncbi:MAG: class I SAM-dependent methyltransferase [Bacteroidota bacterium]
MLAPLFYRKNIPFFCHKSEADFRKDPYEQYDSMVVRQSALHLADQLWGQYPMQAVLDFAEAHYSDFSEGNILEVGCGVGRWIASLAQHYPQASCWGIDYSYQMLKRAQEYWVQGKEITIDLSDKGLGPALGVPGHQLSNLQFGLAKAEELPFAANSQDLVVSSFLLDRLEEPLQGLKELFRVLRPGGRLILITPLNFQQAAHWESLYPTDRLRQVMRGMGFNILTWEENIVVEESLDIHSNIIRWSCLGLVAGKAA